MRSPRNSWTEADMKKGRELFNRLKSYAAVARAMGRSQETVRRNLKGLEYHRSDGSQDRWRVHQEKAPQAVFDERTRRLALSPRDLTAHMLGDPLPGYSALDRRHG